MNNIPEKHQKRIALQTLRMNNELVAVMGGMDKVEAREVLRRMGYTEAQLAQVESENVRHEVL